MASRRAPLRRSFVVVTASVVAAGLGCGGSVDGGATTDGGPLSTSCPTEKPVQGTACAVDPSLYCTSSCGSPSYWVSQCVEGAWKDGFGSCNPPPPPYDAGPDARPDVLPDVVGESRNPPAPDTAVDPDAPTTCPDVKPVDGTPCAVDPVKYCASTCDSAHFGAGMWAAQCVDHRWQSVPAPTCNPPPPPPDTGVDAEDASDGG